MTRRLFYITFGAVAGVLAVRRATTAAQRYTPAGVQHRLSGALGGFGEQAREFWAEVRIGRAGRERALRTCLGLDATHDVGHAGL